MSYDNMSRALRFYYDKFILNKVSGKRHTYRFNFGAIMQMMKTSSSAQGQTDLYGLINAYGASQSSKVYNSVQRTPLQQEQVYRCNDMYSVKTEPDDCFNSCCAYDSSSVLNNCSYQDRVPQYQFLTNNYNTYNEQRFETCKLDNCRTKMVHAYTQQRYNPYNRQSAPYHSSHSGRNTQSSYISDGYLVCWVFIMNVSVFFYFQMFWNNIVVLLTRDS